MLLHQNKRPRRKAINSTGSSAPLSFDVESLEQRQLLAGVVVDNALDVVNGDTSSISSLIASDGGDGISLREAVDAANATAGADTITFDTSLSGATISLAGTELAVSDALTIDAEALPKNVTIDASGASRVLSFNVSHSELNLNSLTITGGRTNGAGGGIFFRGYRSDFNAKQCTISGNSAGTGGGIYSNFNNGISLNQSTVSGNSASDGGAVYSSYSRLTLVNSTVSGNSATQGGAISAGSNPLTFISSTITENSASDGGGIKTFLSGGSFTNTSPATQRLALRTTSVHHSLPLVVTII